LENGTEGKRKPAEEDAVIAEVETKEADGTEAEEAADTLPAGG
jgi:hypothetical protein